MKKQYGQVGQDNSILDHETSLRIISTMNSSNHAVRGRVECEESVAPKKTFGSFKSMKRDKQRAQKNSLMENAGTNEMEEGDASEVHQIKRDLEMMHEEEQRNSMY